MPGVITTCEKCGAQYAWNTDFQQCPDCPKCGYNWMKINKAKRDKCSSAAERGDLASVKQALRDPDVRKSLNAGPLTILHHAVSGNQIDVVKYLLSQGAKPDATYQQAGNRTPLHIAASMGYRDIAKVLIESGARVDARDSSGSKPIDKAIDDATRALLQPYDDKASMLGDYFEAVKNGKVDRVDTFLEKGIDPNEGEPRYEGAAALHFACGLFAGKGFSGCSAQVGRRMAEALLRHGADPNIRRNAGITALHDAAMNGRADIAELLIEHGADVNVRDQNVSYRTPLHVALESMGGPDEGRVEVAKLLVEKGADIDAADKYGTTPITQAAMYIAVHKKPQEKANPSDDDFALLKVFLDAGGTLHKDDLPVKWVTNTKAVPNPAFVAYLKSYAEQNPNSPQATGPIKRRKRIKESSGRDSSSTEDKKPKEGCFIATACYGSPVCAEVLLLRKFRDRYLVQSLFGRAAVRIYYYFSPLIAGALSRTPSLKTLVRRVLVGPVVWFVSVFSDDRSEGRGE